VGDEGQTEASELAAVVECQESTVADDARSQRDTKEDFEDDAMLMPIKAKRSGSEEHRMSVADDSEAVDQAASAAIKMQIAPSVSSPAPHKSMLILTASLKLHSQISVQLKTLFVACLPSLCSYTIGSHSHQLGRKSNSPTI
jgi:hypothetical protein